MQSLKYEFIEFLNDVGVLKFGSFTLKSGRRSPYFFNMGEIASGTDLVRLGRFYARATREHFGMINNIFGPAYKGIVLAAAAAIGFELEFGEEVKYCYNRKEEKAHGESGSVVGSRPEAGERLVIVDDVLTTGGTKYEAVQLLRSFEGVEIAGLLIGMNRRERGGDGNDAAAGFTADTGIPVAEIANVYDVIDYLKGKGFESSLIKEMRDYIAEYGI